MPRKKNLQVVDEQSDVKVEAAVAVDETPKCTVVEAKPAKLKVSNCVQLNVRNTPNGKVLATIPCGTEVFAEQTDDAEWAKIRCKDSDIEGYAMKAYLA